jgi:hypothetical protein
VDIARSTGCRHKAFSTGWTAHSSDKDSSCRCVELALADRKLGGVSKELTTLRGTSLSCYEMLHRTVKCYV